MPRSVTIAVTYRWGVMSKAGFEAPTPSGATRDPPMWVTSEGSRCSMAIAPPSGVGRRGGGRSSGRYPAPAAAARGTRLYICLLAKTAFPHDCGGAGRGQAPPGPAPADGEARHAPPAHPLDRPEEVDRRGASGGE